MQSDVIQARFGFIRRGDVLELRNRLAMLPPNSVCVNIGAGVGTSGLLMREASNVVKSYTVDIVKDDTGNGGLGNERNAFKEAGFEPSPRHEQICGNSSDIGRMWDHGQLDLVFVDGDHSYEGAKADIEAWYPHVKVGGLIVVHDYFTKDQAEGPLFPGVKQAVDETLRPVCEFISLVEITIAFRKVK